jgi:hypothetical protein
MFLQRIGLLPALSLVVAAVLIVATFAPPKTSNAQETALSVVYLDAGKPAGTILWVAATDGSTKRPVGEMLGPGIWPLDLRAGLLAVADRTDLVTVNLADGSTKTTSVGARVTSAYIANSSTVYFSTHVGCGPVEATAMVGRFDLASGTTERVVDVTGFPGSIVLSHNANADELTMASRACDPGINEIWTMSARNGEKKQSVPVEGCGWAMVSPVGSQALVSFDACKFGGGDTFPNLRAYTLPGGASKEIRYDKDAPSRHEFVYAPDGKRAAYGLAIDRDAQNGVAKSGGIWTLDAASLEKTKLWQDAGQESWAIDWSPDGSKLLVASREEENLCTFSVVDVPSANATKIAGLTGCGEKGTLIGFFAQP